MPDPVPSVLIVEDERQIRRFVRSTLEAEGCRVFARLDAPPATVSADLAVSARFVDRGGWTELRFAPMEPTS